MKLNTLLKYLRCPQRIIVHNHFANVLIFEGWATQLYKVVNPTDYSIITMETCLYFDLEAEKYVTALRIYVKKGK